MKNYNPAWKCFPSFYVTVCRSRNGNLS